VDHQLEDLKQVRQLLAGGDVLSGAQVESFLAAADGSTLINRYGPTENTTFTCCHSMWKPERAAASVPIGRPVANTQVYILDRNLRPVAQGCVGELYIGGCGLARGYFNRPELTAEKFIPHPFGTEAGARLYRSGDLARYLPSGDIEFVGRTDEQVKIRGYRIELGEVEAALSGHPGTREAVVLARDTAAGEKQLAAYLTTRDERAPSIKELRQYLKQKLPEYMVPSAIVVLDEMPLTANGKVDRRALPAPAQVTREETLVTPRNAIEEQLAKLWIEMLGLKEVSINDNFFDLGGHSLLASRLVSRVRETFHVELPLRSFFEAATIEEMARAMIAHEAKPGQTEKIAQFLKRLDTMSAEEVKVALQKSAGGD
jgi:aspartate racemase